MHVREQAREAARTILEGIVGVTAHDNEAALVEDWSLPAVAAMTPTEESELSAKGDMSTGPLVARTIHLVAAVAVDGDTPEADLDALAVQIEAGFGEDLGLTGFDCWPTGTDTGRSQVEDGDRWYAHLTMSWAVRVYTTLGDPETPR